MLDPALIVLVDELIDASLSFVFFFPLLLLPLKLPSMLIKLGELFSSVPLRDGSVAVLVGSSEELGFCASPSPSSSPDSTTL